jgi:hypothetical protein
VQTDYEQHSEYPTEIVVLDATLLVCEVCNLTLNGSEELDAAGIDVEIENDGAEVGDLYGDYQPDEDWFRDR